MRKKLKKLCALVLSAVTVLSVLPSSGLVSAETDADITAEESVQSTVYLKVPNPSGQVIVTSNANTDEEVIQTITVDEEKTTLTDNEGNTSDVTLTQEGYCLELTEEVGETINLEFVASDGYEVGTYRILTDSGDEVENVTLSDDNKYEYTFTEDDQVLEVTFKAIESADTTSDETTEEETIVEDTTPVEETEPVAEETTSNEVTETAEETTSDDVWYDFIDEGEDPFAELQALEEQQAKENARSSMLRSGVTTNGQKTVSEALGINPTTYLNYVKTYSTSGNTYYLTTPYPSQSDANNYFRGVYDFRSPNGDRWQGFNKLQCTGFVWHVLWKCGASATSIPHLKVSNPVQQKYSYYTGGWVNWLKNNNVTVHNYSNKQAMLDSGTLDYGDIIWIWDESVGAAGSSNYHHIGIYVGDGETDKFWNSDPSHGNAIDTIHGKASVISYTVVDTAPPTGSGGDSDEVSSTFNKINYLKQVYEEGKKNYLTSNSLSESSVFSSNSIFKSTPSTLSIASRAVGDVVYTDSLSGYRSPISITQYPPGGGYNIIKTWNEGLLGATPSTWMFCADPTKNFQAGYKTGYPATNYFSDYAIKLMGALLYWYDTNKCSGISLGDDYMFKQEIVWTIGNLDRGWYSNVLFEHGNGQTCDLGHSLYTHRDEWYYTGLQWASNNYGNVSTTATVYDDGVGGQPLIELYYTYNPTGSGYIVKTSSNTSLTSGNSNYNLTGATYNIYKTKSDAQNNKNAISGKQFKIASNSGKSNTVELNAGTYYIKEVPGSDGTGYTTSNTIYTITITAGKTNVNLTPSGGIKNTPKTATIDLYKTPSNPICVENNENYSLEGAVYGVYTNKSCTSLKTKATTNADGEFSVTNLPLGQYWVKEISPSPGYLVDTNVYAVDARTEGSGPVRVFTVESHETPILDPDNLLLKKVDSNTNGAPEDQGTMEGAEFEVKFYGIAVDEIADGTDPATLGYQPTRTWVLKTYTTSNGSAALIFDNAFKVSGDDFYYTSSGDIAFPFGVITIKETKAPNGYLINDQVIVQKITDANGGNDSTIIDHVPTQLEDSLTLRVVKTQYDTEKVIPGVTYRWTRPDGTVNTYTTDKNGVIEFHGLTGGKHTIEEIDVPDGYAVNTNKIEFTVAQDNTITFDKEYPMSDTDGVITISLDTEGNMDVDYTNKPAPFDLKIHKVNNHNFPLEGAEFTLYSDEKCTQVVDVQVTDSDGELTFADLIPYKEYWMKETDAPPGYRIPVNDDGSDIIWKIDVESVPVNDEFTFNVNDTAYTVQSTGSIWIDGTKADRVCNMTVVNEVGMKLPNTGSSMMILLLIAGVMLMGGAIVISRKSRKTSDDKE